MSKLARSMVPTHLNLRIQALRILAHRIRNDRPEGRLPEGIVVALMDPEPRVRFETVQAIWQAKQTHLRSALIDGWPRRKTVWFSTPGGGRSVT